ncbi:hypothetical protein N356_gp108 [Cellulophaga phage phi14:2]|uniref:Uncharacterized protein n=1 Tax=Cellulophaga phage phi14:2 TaxID=1327990 RepID=S0A0B7_9CAUD|nr:hypothetical protein N356_gp108 [Cellulophaga phage phi14:2]AGO49004.1 hypothetical protein Phi14:2_gp126 [Cellulophaga phage phi14:2]
MKQQLIVCDAISPEEYQQAMLGSHTISVDSAYQQSPLELAVLAVSTDKVTFGCTDTYVLALDALVNVN